MKKYIILSFIVSCAFMACQEASTPSEKTEVTKEIETENKSYYTEKHRPQFHFSPDSMWMNDPNGMVYYEGEYHLFYQYYPGSTVWGPMHWGHAISEDLVHWKHFPIALYPDDLGYIFSGSAVIDWKNTSGLGKNDAPPMVAIYTYHDMEGEKKGTKDYQTQGIAYSNDKGRTWTKYKANPVLPNTEKIKDFRDPKVFWMKDTEQWVMTLAVQDHVRFFGSKNLIDWTYLSAFGKEMGEHGGVWECPDLFPMEVEGTGEKKWVLLLSINPSGPNGGSATQYFIGDFDGKTFSLDETFEPSVQNGNAVWLDYGRDNYAGVTWSDIPKEDGRRLFMGWMSNWDYARDVPTEKWRSAMTIPRVLALEKTAQSYRLYSQPAKELEELRSKTYSIESMTLSEPLKLSQTSGISAHQSELILDLEVNDAKKLGVELSNDKGERYRIAYDVEEKAYFSDRTKTRGSTFSEKFAPNISIAKRLSDDKNIRMHLFFDAASVELFADDGVSVMTEIIFPSEDFNQLKIFSEGGTAKIIEGKFFDLKGIWP